MHVRRPKGAARAPAGPFAPWTYELPPEGDGSAGLEGYGVESAFGEWVGTVFLVLEHGRERYLAVRPLSIRQRDARIVPWADVAAIDHAARAVRLTLSGERLAAASRLARDRGVHGRGAEAVRVTNVSLWPSSVAAHSDAVATRYLLGVGLSALGFLALLGVALLASGPYWTEDDYALLAVPVALLLAALVGGLGLLERPRASRGRS